ncbi:MAG: FHA domain-containing protein [Cyanobacteria bacterium P01_H01_bin.121]
MPTATLGVLIVHDLEGVHTHKLKQSCYVIGRSKQADIVLNGSTCSRKHATILQIEDDRGKIHHKIFDGDLKAKRPSANGTIVNGLPIDARVLQNNDQILFGAGVSAKYVQVSGNFIPEADQQTISGKHPDKTADNQVFHVAPRGEVLILHDRQSQ